MLKLKNIISMPVLSLYEGELVGTVSKIYLDKKLKKVSFFVVSCEGDLNYILNPKNVYKLGKNAITIKNLDCLTLDLDTDFSSVVLMPINSKTYTIQGEFVGLIEEITITDNYFVENILLENNNFLNLNQITSCSKNTVIICDNNINFNASKFKRKLSPKIFKSRNKINVQTMPVESIIETSAQSITLPSGATNNPKFLIGRIATKDIMLDEKKYLIKANSTITEKVITLATINNKLKDLMLISKQK